MVWPRVVIQTDWPDVTHLTVMMWQPAPPLLQPEYLLPPDAPRIGGRHRAGERQSDLIFT